MDNICSIHRGLRDKLKYLCRKLRILPSTTPFPFYVNSLVANRGQDIFTLIFKCDIIRNHYLEEQFIIITLR